MKLVFSLLFLCLTPFCKPKADTVDNWQVYYNKKLIGKYSEVSAKPPLVIQKSKVQATDSLMVVYSTDTPYNDYITDIYFFDKKKNKVLLARGKGTWMPLKTSLLKLATKGADYGIILDIYYEDGHRNRKIFKLIFK